MHVSLNTKGRIPLNEPLVSAVEKRLNHVFSKTFFTCSLEHFMLETFAMSVKTYNTEILQKESNMVYRNGKYAVSK